jgi:hypothetical protein
VKIIRRVFLTLVTLVVLAIVAALSSRAMWQHRIANEVKINSPNGIDEAKFIDIHGAQEWITIRGDNRNNPVIVFLHGGPSEAAPSRIPQLLARRCPIRFNVPRGCKLRLLMERRKCRLNCKKATNGRKRGFLNPRAGPAR